MCFPSLGAGCVRCPECQRPGDAAPADGGAHAGDSDGGTLPSWADSAGRRGGATVSRGVAVFKCRAGARGRAVQHEPVRPRADQ